MQPNNILFRAKHLKADYYDGDLIPEGRWLYGWYYQNQCNGNVEHNIILPREKGSQGQAGLAIDPNTLCQFTGLHDAQGKQIFNGDIIKDEIGEIYVICWYADLSAFMAEMVCNEKPFMIYDIAPQDCYIIGNIFDNPELLK